MKQLPKAVTNAILASLAEPDETGMMRVIVRRVMNQSPFTLRGKARSYRAEYNRQIGAHALDIPLSLWNGGQGGSVYRDNASVAHDIQANRGANNAPLVFLVLPWNGAAAVTPASPVTCETVEKNQGTHAAAMAQFQRLLEVMDAPVEVTEGLKLALDGHAEALRLFTDSLAVLPEPEPFDMENGESPEPPAKAKRGPGRPRKQPVTA